ncbi:hypothetical protein Q21_gp8 [Vibrio phage VPp1]|nr:hypothetical protein Q21_gp8 [Vibrio phage VPp1]
MKEAKGNMLCVDCDAIVVTTNGFVKKDGSNVMGRGIAKQMSMVFPQLPQDLGNMIDKFGNKVYVFQYEHLEKDIVTFPVKPRSQINDGTNVVSHLSNRFKIGCKVPGYAIKAQIDIIKKSLKELVELADIMGWTNIICPRFGCGAGELEWSVIKKMAEKYLDDRFTVYTF